MTEVLICECGWRVTGRTAKHLEANHKIHKSKSKIHKHIMQNREKQ